MTADEVMSEQIRLDALARHIEDAIVREGIAAPDAAEFRRHLERVKAAQDALAVIAGNQGAPNRSRRE